MDVRVDIAIPLIVAGQIKTRLDKLRGDLLKKIEHTEKKIKAGKADAIGERKALVAQLNKLSPNNMLRIATLLGAEAMNKVTDEEIFDQVMGVGLVRGRKKHAA